MFFLPRQPRFCLQESYQKVKICFFRQESCTEGMAKESCLTTKKNKNLARTMSRTSTSERKSQNTQYINLLTCDSNCFSSTTCLLDIFFRHIYILVIKHVDLTQSEQTSFTLIMTIVDNNQKNIKLHIIRTISIEEEIDVQTNIEHGTSDDPNDKKLLRKLDLHLIPTMTLLYLLSYLDRVNIGQAKIDGLMESLNLTSAQYNACLSVFFVTYVAFEIPSNLILKKLRPSRWIPIDYDCMGNCYDSDGSCQFLW